MISLYSGTPGSGKSFHASLDVYNRLKYNHNVIGNFEINRDVARMTLWSYLKYKIGKIFGIKFNYKRRKKFGNYYYVDNAYITPDFLLQFAKRLHKRRKEGQTLVVIDECGIIFNPRSWDNKTRMEWIKFFSMHRHYGFDFVLISQSDRMIDRQIRCLLEYDVKHKDAKNFKAIGRFLSLFSGGHVFVATTYWYSVRERVGMQYLPINPRVFDLYDTFKTFADEEQKSKTGGEQNAKTNPQQDNKNSNSVAAGSDTVSCPSGEQTV